MSSANSLSIRDHILPEANMVVGIKACTRKNGTKPTVACLLDAKLRHGVPLAIKN